MKKTKYLIFAIVLLLISGCAVKKANTPINTYTITTFPISQPSKQQSKFENKTIKIATPKSTNDILSSKILYSKNEFELDAYTYARWSDTPNKLLHDIFLYTLENAHVFKTTLRSTSRAKADFLLESNLIDFYHNFKKDGTSEGILKIQFYLIDLKTKKITANKFFTSSIKAKSNDSRGAVEALNKATQDITKRLIQWLWE